MKINIGEGISDELALELVLKVVQQGRISVGRVGRKVYCFATVFTITEDPNHEYIVIVNGNTKTDVFAVYKKDKI